LRWAVLACAVTASASSGAAPLAVGDFLMTCAYRGITRISPDGEQHPLGSGGGSTIAEDENGLVWVVDNR
jgi:hypothetical protein